MVSSQMFHAPKRAHVLWSKGLGGFLWFWVLWRLKHDYYDIIGHHHALGPVELPPEEDD